jgi:hypothetical protein
MTRTHPLASAGVLAAALWGSAGTAQAAVNCGISGYIMYEPADRYYCDSDYQTCTGWLQWDLDRYRVGNLGAKGQRYMRLSFWDNAGTRLATAYTNGSGFYSTVVSLPGASCVGQNVRVQREYARVHESDVTLASPRFRFKVTEDDAVTLRASSNTTTLSSSTHTFSVTQAADNSLDGRPNSVYFTMDAAVSEAVGWWSTLATRLSAANLTSAIAVVVDPSYTSATQSETAGSANGNIWVSYSDFATGAQIRHEFGHRIHQVLHSSLQRDDCWYYNYDTTSGHGIDTCEYGYATTGEAIADFLAVRTATSADTNAWLCWKTYSSAQSACASEVATRVGDTDSDGVSSANQYVILGDSWANSASRCTVPLGSSCSCGGAGQPACTTQSTRDSRGFRLEAQVARFLWDMIDANNESSLDDTNLSIGTVVQAFAGMTCSGTADGSCNEPNLTTCTAASKDKYNAYDIGDLLAGDQSQERTLNCVATAPD